MPSNFSSETGRLVASPTEEACPTDSSRSSENQEEIPVPLSEDGLQGSFFSTVQHYSLRIFKPVMNLSVILFCIYD